MSTQYCRFCDRTKPENEDPQNGTCETGGNCEWGDTEPPPPLGTLKILRPLKTRRRLESEREALLTFEHGGEARPNYGNHILIAQPQRPFKPRGLMLWNAGEMQVEAALVGTQLQLVASFGKVPAAWWSSQSSFEAVVQALADGKEAASWGDWDVVYPGMLVRLIFDGPASHVRALMWGHIIQ